MNGLSGKTALMTGASRGIGRASAFAKARAQVLIQTTLLPLPSTGSNCCTRENGARTLTANRLSKSYGCGGDGHV